MECPVVLETWNMSIHFGNEDDVFFGICLTMAEISQIIFRNICWPSPAARVPSKRIISKFLPLLELGQPVIRLKTSIDIQFSGRGLFKELITKIICFCRGQT